MQLVSPFDPQGSKLYTVLFVNPDETMPPNNPFSLAQKSIIYWWIAQGAYNNKCDSAGCDSANVTYTASINPIVSSWCIGCHGGSNPSNGLSLETYSDVVACAKSNRLMGSLRHETGYYAMPKGGEMLSICEINLFQKWIDLGEPQ
jgi:mono/diheme cytochrome c family protein